MVNFFKGIIVGIGGVAPGLSGSVLLIIFGLYQKTLESLGTLFRDFRKNLKFLLPLVAGMFLGVLLFSKVINFTLTHFEMPTRFCFMGLILGTIPMVWNEVKKDGFSRKYYILILFSAVAGLWFFTVNPDAFPQVSNPTLIQSIALGIAVAATAIIPGVDPAVFLSTLGFYEMYVNALATLNLTVLIPMILGLASGAVAISFGMNLLFKRFYTGTYSIIFGIFLSMVPNMLNNNCLLGLNAVSVVSLILLILGFSVSFYLGDLETNNRRIQKFLANKKKRRG